VLLAGGAADLFDGTSNFVATGPMTTARVSPTATLLGSGKVLVAGGYLNNSLPSAELFAQLSAGAACVASGDCSSGYCNENCCASSCSGACTTCDTNGACQTVASAEDPDSCTGMKTCDGNGVCRLKVGQPCPNGNGDCANAQCVDGFCCDTACTGQCEACDGNKGTCAPVSGAPHGSRTPCTGTASACAGACDGSHNQACGYPAPSTPCVLSCAGSTETVGACDGQGMCGGSSMRPCAGNLVCADAKRCRLSCTTDADCVSNFVCSSATCVVPAGGDGGASSGSSGSASSGGSGSASSGGSGSASSGGSGSASSESGGSASSGGCACSLAASSRERGAPAWALAAIAGACLALRRRRPVCRSTRTGCPTSVSKISPRIGSIV
jgi:hypothetical protein